MQLVSSAKTAGNETRDQCQVREELGKPHVASHYNFFNPTGKRTVGAK